MSCLIVDCLSARTTLAIMAFFMFLVTQMIRVNLYIAVIAVNDKSTVNGTDRALNDYAWSDKAQSLVLGAFYWSYWATELPGGLIAQRYGGKRVMGLSVGLAAVLNLLLPAACKYHYLVASLLRALQGLALVPCRDEVLRDWQERLFQRLCKYRSFQGVTWPIMHCLSARWIPQAERSKFMTSYHGASVGGAITYPLSGIAITYCGWEFVFYLIGIICLVWCFAWWILVFDSPKEHPRLSEEESKYLAEAIGDAVAVNRTEKTKTPWRHIFKSKSFWGVLVASQGLMWGTITLSMQTPLYFHQVHHLDMKSTGLLSGIPETSKFLFALVFSAIIDRLISKKAITVTAARKLAVAVSEYLPAKFLIVLGLFGSDNVAVAAVLLTLVSLVAGGSSAGSLPNIVDLSPNHAGTLLGIIKTLTVIPGVMSPLVVGHFTSFPDMSKADQWRNIFFFLAVIYMICSTAYLFFGSGEVQPWNQSPPKPKEESAILEKEKDDEKGDSEHHVFIQKSP